MKVEYVEEKPSDVKDDSDTTIYGIRIIAESDLEKGILKEFCLGDIKRNSWESGFNWMELIFRSLIERKEYPDREDYDKYTVHVHKDWLPMLQAMQEAGTFGTRKISIEAILDGLILRKLQQGRDALSDVMLEVNAPTDKEEE